MDEVFQQFEEETAFSPEIADEYHRRGLWGDMSCVDYLDYHAEQRGDESAVVDDDRTLTWNQIRDEATRVAAGLRERGVDPGDPVAYQLPHVAEWHVARLGIGKAGAIAVPLIPRFREQEMTHVISTVEATAYIGPAEYRDYEHVDIVADLREEVDALEHVFSVGGDHPAATPYEELVDTDTTGFSPESIDPDYPDTLNTTSGTTGTPKVYYLQQNGRLTMAKDMIGRFSMTSYDETLVLAPIQQATGELLSYYTLLVSGGTVLITQASDPGDQWAAIDEYDPSFVAAIPTQMTKMMNADETDEHTLESVRVFLNAGAPLPGSTARFFEDKGTITGNFYGASEGGLPQAVCPMDAEEVRFTTVGKPVQSMETKVIDHDDEELANGEVGEVIWRGGNQGFGYYDDPETTAKVFDIGGPWEGWFHSGDAGRIDDQGNLSIEGRMDDMIIRGGQNIYPQEIEDALMKHPAVEEAAIVGMPDPEYGQRACAYVVPAGGTEPSLEDLVEHLDDDGFAKFKWPERLELIDELPRSPGGKIQKTDLEEDIRARLEEERKLG